ncbi:MAG: DNA-3-methyladenine glycosylase [Bacteroidales bacterium]|nr:DNA-3-methyladenine glycosylase [Bacteroidales bacterium]
MKLTRHFYTRDVLEVAPGLLGKYLVLQTSGACNKFLITDVEAYRGTDDLACHASKGLTKRTEPMFRQGGILYIYLIYGMYYMLNIVTSTENNPQAVLIRGIEGCNGPGKLTKKLGIDQSFNREDLIDSNRIWVIDTNNTVSYKTSPRIGVDYAGDYWKNLHWRFYI